MTSTPADREALVEKLQPILDALAGADLAQPAALQEDLGRRFPTDGAYLAEVRALVLQGLEAGWLCPKEANGIRFGRLAKASPSTHDLVIDAVDMDRPGPGHLHPNGEVDLCFSLDGAPTFDGRPVGWTVYGPGSWHVPTVEGGRMAILYFLPGGAITFGPRPG